MRPLLTCLGILSLIIGIGPARAADMPIKAPPRAPDPPSWTGFYIGGHVGPGVGNTKFFDNFPTPDGALDADASLRGWVGGFQLGYNYQINRLVLGLEGNFTWSGVRNDFTCFSFGNQVCSSDAEWFATLTGRVGGVIGSALVYVNGGAAWTRNTIGDLATCVGSQPRSSAGIPAVCGDTFTASDTRPGWTVGVGIEYLLTRNWSVKAEYDYMDFGQRSVFLYDGGGNFFTEEIHQQIQMLKLGFNYKFNWGGGDPMNAFAYQPAGMLTKARPAADQDDETGTIRAFSVVDVSKYSLDGLAGGLFALSKDSDTSGPRVWLAGGAGTYKYYAGGNPIHGTYSTGDLLAGYGFEGDNYSINLLAGASAENDMLTGFDPDNSVHGTQAGAKVRGDIWMNPTPQTLIYAESEYSTAFQTYYTSAKVGYDITNGKQIFVGPEVTAFGDERFDQWRLGGHVTQLKFWKVDVDVSAGYAHDSVVGNGAYGHVEFSTNF